MRHLPFFRAVPVVVAAPIMGLIMGGTTACEKLGLTTEATQDQRPFDVTVLVTSDPGKPLAKAEVVALEKVIATTDAQGTAKLGFTGNEGDIIEVSVKCPAGHDAPPPVGVALRRLAEGSRSPTYEVKCSPKVRTVVVGVRADGGGGLPVVYLGRTVARTDAAGAAHFTLTPKPGEQVELTLDTTERGAELLRPQNPTLTFVTKPYDDFVVLEQKFQSEKRVEHHRPKPAAVSKPMPL